MELLIVLLCVLLRWQSLLIVFVLFDFANVVFNKPSRARLCFYLSLALADLIILVGRSYVLDLLLCRSILLACCPALGVSHVS